MTSFVETPNLVVVVAIDVIALGKTYERSMVVMSSDLFE
jgi:hypothetical protein